MNDIVYSTSASWPHTRGWDAFDRMVLWAASARPAQSFDEVLQLVPDGVLIYLVRRSLEFLRAQGMLARRGVRDGAAIRTVWEATSAGRALLEAAPAARKAA